MIIISLSYQKKFSTNSLCLSPACIEHSHAISSTMNQSIDPCDDFYGFVCGRWKQINIIPKGHSSWSVTSELMKQNSIRLKNLLEQSSTSSITNIEQQAMNYYQSCLNRSEIDRLGIQPLKDFFQTNLNFSLDQWIHISKTQTWQNLFIQLTTYFAKNLATSYALPITVSADEKNSSWNNVYIDQPQLGLRSRDFYINSSTNSEANARNALIRDTYSKVGSDVLQLLGFEKDDAIKRMNQIIQFEIELALISLPMEILQKHDQTYNLMSLKALNFQFQTIGLNIIEILNEMFKQNSISLSENDQIIVLNPKLISDVTNILTDYLLTSEKSSIVIDYILLSFVLGVNGFLPSKFEETILPMKKILLGSDSTVDRWELCVKQTDQAFGFALGSLFIKNIFGEADRSAAQNLIKTIREIFDDDLTKLEWIDDESRSEAKKKLSKVYERIGYPDWIFDQTKLNQRYGGDVMTTNELFSNAMKVINRERRRRLAKYRQQVDRTDWHMTPQTVNAYYSSTFNEMIFPASILQSPFFHKDFPFAVNYGAIGSVIGHEMTHGFDNQGREFDADGNIRSWWSNSSLNNFREKTQCFIQHYSNLSFDGIRINGERSLGENIADNGGLKLAYYAYKKHTKHFLNQMNTRQLPALDYNSDQLFFIAFAHSWCSIETPSLVRYGVINDPHAPNRLRVIGTVQNSEEFARAFSCRTNQNMNPKHKCQLW